MLVSKPKQQVVISEPDIENALNHLNSLPHTATKRMPKVWGITQVKEWLISELPKKLKVGDSFQFGTGLWGHIKPLGYEFSGYVEDEKRLQVIISVRTVQTDLNKLIEINQG